MKSDANLSALKLRSIKIDRNNNISPGIVQIIEASQLYLQELIIESSDLYHLKNLDAKFKELWYLDIYFDNSEGAVLGLKRLLESCQDSLQVLVIFGLEDVSTLSNMNITFPKLKQFNQVKREGVDDLKDIKEKMSTMDPKILEIMKLMNPNVCLDSVERGRTRDPQFIQAKSLFPENQQNQVC